MKARIVSFLLLLAAFAGCSTQPRPIVPVPASLEAAPLLEVKRHWTGLGKRPMRFGEWQVEDYDRKGLPGNRSWAVGPGEVKYGQSRGWAAYSFRLASETRDAWECDCRFKKKSREISIDKPDESFEVTLTYEDSLRCDLWRAGDTEPWKLVVYGSLWLGGEGYSGILARGDRTLVLEPNHQIQGLGKLPGAPMGYLFLRDDEEVAAAELIRPGFVRIDDAAGEDRDAVATAIAALLMQP